MMMCAPFGFDGGHAGQRLDGIDRQTQRVRGGNALSEFELNFDGRQETRVLHRISRFQYR